MMEFSKEEMKWFIDMEKLHQRIERLNLKIERQCSRVELCTNNKQFQREKTKLRKIMKELKRIHVRKDVLYEQYQQLLKKE